MDEKTENEKINNNAAEYVLNFEPTGVITEDRLKCYKAGAHSRDEEIKELNSQVALHKDRADYYHDLYMKLRNPN